MLLTAGNIFGFARSIEVGDGHTAIGVHDRPGLPDPHIRFLLSYFVSRGARTWFDHAELNGILVKDDIIAASPGTEIKARARQQAQPRSVFRNIELETSLRHTPTLDLLHYS